MSPQDSSNRLLTIDDDVKLCRLITSYLTPPGYDVSVAHTGREGLDRALHEPFSAILLDVMVPGLNGFDLLRELHPFR